MFRSRQDRDAHASFHDDRDLAAFLDTLAHDPAADDGRNTRRRGRRTARLRVGGLGLLIAGLVCLLAVLYEGGASLALN